MWLGVSEGLCSWHSKSMCAETQQPPVSPKPLECPGEGSFAEHTSSSWCGWKYSKMLQKMQYFICLALAVPWGITPDTFLSHTLFADCTVALWKAGQQTLFLCDVYILFLSPWVLLYFLILAVLGTWRYLMSLLLPSSCLPLLVAGPVISTFSFHKKLFSFNFFFSPFVLCTGFCLHGKLFLKSRLSLEVCLGLYIQCTYNQHLVLT